jgi:hypothetical protein
MINNYLSTGGFILSIKRMPNVEFFTQKATIPGLSASAITTPSPLNQYFEPGDELGYEDLTLEFVIDEDMKNYMEVHDWLVGLTSPQSTDQFKALKNSEFGLKSDITLTILNSHKNPTVQVTYYDCFPIGLDSVQMDTNNSDVTYAIANGSFKYNYYTMKSVK